MRKKKLTLVQKLRGEIKNLNNVISDKQEKINTTEGILDKIRSKIPAWAKQKSDKDLFSYPTKKDLYTYESVEYLNETVEESRRIMNEARTENKILRAENSKLWWLVRIAFNDKTTEKENVISDRNLANNPSMAQPDYIKTPFD